MNIAITPSRVRYRLKMSAGVVFCVMLIGLSLLVGRHLTGTSWPLQGSNAGLVGAAASTEQLTAMLR